MTRTVSVLAALTLAACSRPNIATPRYAIEIFSVDTVQAHVTVIVTTGLEAQMNGAGFYAVNNNKQPVVLTPMSLVLRGTGTATISAIDSMQQIAVVPAGTHPDSTESVTTIGRILRVTRAV